MNNGASGLCREMQDHLNVAKKGRACLHLLSGIALHGGLV